MLFLILSVLVINTTAQQVYCDADYLYYNGWCYKYYQTPTARGSYDDLSFRCALENATLAPGDSAEEIMFLDAVSHNDVITRTQNGDTMGLSMAAWQECLLLGAHRNPANMATWITSQQQSISYPWCPAVGNDNGQRNENCAIIVPRQTTPPCVADLWCGTPFSFYRYVCRKGPYVFWGKK